ncbi:tetratricopeptide repeat protein [uncultured Paraglaciecola sp.]|uniref:tetratricopeptide repeat protein n=1 Tax=uncultured Paraglaciecola sp. TaxID=1765024 RepID=UPI002594A1BE|nr:tetratricopeptide repeat protein [uncultured Paraglaciecola sp.]
MKYTKYSSFVWAGIGLMLAGCANLPFSESTQEPPEVSDTATAETVEPLTPLQIKVLDLKAQPNLYAQQYSQSNQTLSPLLKKQFTQAIAYKAEGELEQAESLFKHLSETQPQLSGVWLQLGSIALLKGSQLKKAAKNTSLDKSETYLTNAITANELNFKAHNLLGQVYRNQGQFTQALHHYDKAIEIWPAFPEAYVNRGILYDLYLGDKSLALDDYTLYQALLDEPSRQVKGWIADLKRQIKAQQQNGGPQ